MNLVEFFGIVIKPKKVRGKGLFCPIENSNIFDGLYCVRDKDVNFFLVKTSNGYIAVDSAYKNSTAAEDGLKILDVDRNDVKAVFLTHLDLDHAGGVDSRCVNLFPQAKVYLGCDEAKYLTKEYARKKIAGLTLSSPIKLRDGYQTVNDNEIVTIDGIEVKAISSHGHTWGHTSYAIGGYLFVGDTLILSEKGEGYCFWDFWNTDSSMNIISLNSLLDYSKKNNVKYIITSHSGYSQNIDKAFSHRGEYLDWRKKGFVFRSDAPYDLYKELKL